MSDSGWTRGSIRFIRWIVFFCIPWHISISTLLLQSKLSVLLYPYLHSETTRFMSSASAQVAHDALHQLRRRGTISIHGLPFRQQHQIRTVCTWSRPRSAHNGLSRPSTLQPSCRAPADPYVEHDPLVVALDLILLKRGVYRHLLFNRGTPPRKVDQTAHKHAVDDDDGQQSRKEQQSTEEEKRSQDRAREIVSA